MGAEDGSALCKVCGHCCDGTVVGYASLTAEEGDVAIRLRLPVFQKSNGGAAFSLPCPHLGADGCRTYEDRPLVCRKYECKVLDRLLTGEIVLGDALSLVDKLTGLIERVRAQIGPQDPSKSIFLQTEAYLAALGDVADTEQFRRDNAGFWMDLTELRALVVRHFSREA